MTIIHDPCGHAGCSTPGPYPVLLCFLCTLKHCPAHAYDHQCQDMLSPEEAGHLFFQRRIPFLATHQPLLPNLLNIKQHAVWLRGRSCRIEFSKDKLVGQGGMVHVHFPLVFDDGVQWLVRMMAHSKSQFHSTALRAEYDVIQSLRKLDPVLVPETWIGEDYLLMEHLPGASLQRQDKFPAPDNVYLDIAAFHIKIASNPYEGIGMPAEGGSLGPVISFRNQVHVSGPFPNLQQFHLAQIDSRLAYAIEWGGSTGLMILALLDIRDVVAASQEMAEDSPTYLMNEDSKRDCYLTEDDRLTGVVDWELTRTAPAFEAFMCPPGLNADRLADAYKALGRADLAAIAVDRKYCHLQLLLGPPFSLYKHDKKFVSLQVSRLRKLFGVAEPSDSPEEWFELASERHKNNTQFQTYLAREEVRERNPWEARTFKVFSSHLDAFHEKQRQDWLEQERLAAEEYGEAAESVQKAYFHSQLHL